MARYATTNNGIHYTGTDDLGQILTVCSYGSFTYNELHKFFDIIYTLNNQFNINFDDERDQDGLYQLTKIQSNLHTYLNTLIDNKWLVILRE